jgi:hypothetical protein
MSIHPSASSRPAEAAGITRLRRSLIRLQDETRLLRRDLLRRTYAPSQPRIPAGSSGGQNVAPVSAVMTDEDRAFAGLAGDYYHHTVSHSKGEYVRHYTIHTNGIEAVWALLKRQIVGIHHWVSSQHLNKYVDVMTWRYNSRDMTVGPRMNHMVGCVESRLRY